MSAPPTDKSSSSIAWRIAGGFWWRRLLRWLVVDVIAVALVLLALWLGYVRDIPPQAYFLNLIPIPDASVRLDHSPYFGDVVLWFEFAQGQYRAFNLGADLLALTPAFAVLAAYQCLSLLGVLFDVRRVRRRLRPLNSLALHAESLGSKDIMDASKIESLEQAIERASIDSPQVKTGVDDLASIEVALNSLLRRMQEAKLQQIRFVSDASHELRTPIAVILGYVNMLDRWGKDDPAVLDESIAALKAEGAHMQELVEQLLFLARSDSGRNTLAPVEVNVASVVAEVCRESSMIDAVHTYKLDFDADAALADEQYLVMADRDLLKQSARVMVQNAGRYSATNTTITLGVYTEKDCVCYKVQDEGIGMTQDEAAHIFERFWRADAARDTSKEGTGLGLSIARQIVEDHGGTIELLSRKGVGSRFVVRIPRGPKLRSR